MKATIKFESRTSDPDSRGCEVVATVWPVVEDADGSALDDAVVKSQAVFIGARSTDSESSVEVPQAGRYLVDVAFPSGQRARRTISVSESEPFLFLLTEKAAGSRSPSSEVKTGIVPTVLAAVRSAVGAYDLEIRSVRVPNDPTLIGFGNIGQLFDKLASTSSDGEIIERIGRAELRHTKYLPPKSGNLVGQHYERSWLMIRDPGRTQTLVAYPQEWHTPQSNDAPFQLVLERKSEKANSTDAKWMTHLKLCDSYYGSVVEYLTRRDTRAQKAMMSSLRAPSNDMLYGKMENPFAAAAGSYMFALGSRPNEEQQAWMKNLCDWFPWLPDGPIALGWTTLRTEDSRSQSWQAARALFIEACSRGLPYYSVGLRILVDALTLLTMSEPDNTQLRSLLSSVTAVDLASVKSEPFTTVQIWRYQRMQKIHS